MTGQLSFDIGDNIEKSAVISDCGLYRYELRRRWSDGPLLEWVMLNPSTADSDIDDPTIRRCIGFAKAWGFNGIRVCNLFALRATDPAELSNPMIDPTGPDNHHHLRIERGPITVCAWGSHPVIEKRATAHLRLAAREGALMCLGYNKDGSPKHPLYVAKTAAARPWPKPDPTERNYT